MPGPPPGAGVPIGSRSLVAFVPEALVAVDVMGAAAGLGEAVIRLNQERLAGLGEAAAVDSAAAVSFFLERCFFSPGEAAGDSAEAGL